MGEILLTIVVTMPYAVVLVLALSETSVIFSMGMGTILQRVFSLFDMGIVIGNLVKVITKLFIFKTICRSHERGTSRGATTPGFGKSVVVVGVILYTVLLMCAVFMVVRFGCLFTKGTLPRKLACARCTQGNFFRLLTLAKMGVTLVLTIVGLAGPRDKG